MPTLEFKGKPFVYSHHHSVPFRELVIDARKSLPGGKKASLDDNLVIHGDNLDALKALLPRYAGKVDLIYIDPPYNTGNEKWGYNDNVNSPLMREWLGKIVDREDLERHDKWLCMMWPRLTLLKELLSSNGAIFVSIDDGELSNLITLMTDIFGDNHVATVPVVNNLKGRNDKKNFARTHEYIVIFDKGNFVSRGLPLTPKQLATFKHFDERGERYTLRDMRKRGGADTRKARQNLFFPVYYNDGKRAFSLKRSSKSDLEILPRKSDGTDGCWKWGREKVENNLGILQLSKGRNGSFGVGYRLFLNPDAQPGGDEALDEEDAWDEEKEEPIERVSKSKSFWWGPELSTDVAKKALKKIMRGGIATFEHPKPVALIKRIVHMASDADSIILDSFAGSGTTAHAVLEANASDGGRRKFILVETEAYADRLTAERVRRVIKGVPDSGDEGIGKGLGGSFTYCELGESINLDRFFQGKEAPEYDQLARYVVYTATGQSIAEVPKTARNDWFIAQAGGYRIYLIYRSDLEFMRSNEAALSLQVAQRIAKAANGKPALVYAAAKFLSNAALSAMGVTFCQLPYAIHRVLGEAPDAP
jgi:adenine-specific DNA-methyltransferase